MGKKIDAYISVGSVFAFKVVLDKKGIPHSFIKLLAKFFSEQIGVINFDKENLILNKKIINYFFYLL